MLSKWHDTRFTTSTKHNCKLVFIGEEFFTSTFDARKKTVRRKTLNIATKQSANCRYKNKNSLKNDVNPKFRHCGRQSKTLKEQIFSKNQLTKNQGENVMKNWTSGSIFKNILLFSLPYLLSYFLQMLYGLADLFIGSVRQCCRYFRSFHR